MNAALKPRQGCATNDHAIEIVHNEMWNGCFEAYVQHPLVSMIQLRVWELNFFERTKA